MYKKSGQYHNKNQKWNRTKKDPDRPKQPIGAGRVGQDVVYVRTKWGVKRRVVNR